MKAGCLKTSLVVSIVVVAAAVGVSLWTRSDGEHAPGRRGNDDQRVVPVETAAVERGVMEQRRRFSGTLAPSAQISVAPKISGRIASLVVDIADTVERGQEIALLDDAEFAQAVTSARAERKVAEARALEAKNRLQLARRELERVRTLSERGVVSDADLDRAQTDFIMRDAAHQVAQANLAVREAALSTAKIRLSYTRVTASWAEGDEVRLVAARHKDDGDTVAANTPLLTVVRIQPVRAVFFVPERDFGMLEAGQEVVLRTDAFPGETFSGRVSRVAPVFQEDSRQARVEVLADNEDERLKPGMFVRVGVVLRSLSDAITIPLEGITRRGSESGVFLVSDAGDSVSWVPVETGVESNGRVQILSPDGLSGRVVTLGQQLLGDGSRVRVVDDANEDVPVQGEDAT